MAYLKESEDLNQEIDYNFFDDDFNDKSEQNNNVLAEEKERNNDSSDKNETSKPKTASLKGSSSEELDIPLDNCSILSDGSETSELSSSRHSSAAEENKSHSSQNSSPKNLSEKSLSTNSSNRKSSRDHSASESDVTSVSSLDSEPHRSTPKSQQTIPRGKTRLGQHITHVDDTEDVDRVKPEAILRAMIRIHEERRAMRQSRPKWVDPNTKDYSVSGITNKMNLIPERIISASKKNIRNNPFFSHYKDQYRRPYHTAINRVRELERIEKENRTIYERLKKVQPSQGITKEQLLKDYSKANRFSLPPRCSPFANSSYYSLTSTNSRSSSHGRRTQSSASLNNSRSDAEAVSVSRKYGNGRVLSASSLRGSQARPYSDSDQSRVVKKSKY